MNHKLSSRQHFVLFFVEKLAPNGFCKIDQGNMQHSIAYLSFIYIKMRKLDMSMVRAKMEVVSKNVLYSLLSNVVIYFIETIILTEYSMKCAWLRTEGQWSQLNFTLRNCWSIYQPAFILQKVSLCCKKITNVSPYEIFLSAQYSQFSIWAVCSTSLMLFPLPDRIAFQTKFVSNILHLMIKLISISSPTVTFCKHIVTTSK